MASLKLLTKENTPNDGFKFGGTVSTETKEVHSEFENQKNAISNKYQELSSRLTALSNQMTNDAHNYKKKLDAKKVSKLETLAKAMKKQAQNCENRRKAMIQAAEKDSEEVRNAAIATAWTNAIDALLAEGTLSDSVIEALNVVKDSLNI